MSKSAMSCDHANEVPAFCTCVDDCYCKEHTCKPAILEKKSVVLFKPYDTVWHREWGGFTPERGHYGKWYTETIITVYIAQDNPEDVIYELNKAGYANSFHLRSRDVSLKGGDMPNYEDGRDKKFT